jgi:hypothetical protein
MIICTPTAARFSRIGIRSTTACTHNAVRSTAISLRTENICTLNLAMFWVTSIRNTIPVRFGHYSAVNLPCVARSIHQDFVLYPCCFVTVRARPNATDKPLTLADRGSGACFVKLCHLHERAAFAFIASEEEFSHLSPELLYASRTPPRLIYG